MSTIQACLFGWNIYGEDAKVSYSLMDPTFCFHNQVFWSMLVATSDEARYPNPGLTTTTPNQNLYGGKLGNVYFHNSYCIDKRVGFGIFHLHPVIEMGTH